MALAPLQLSVSIVCASLFAKYLVSTCSSRQHIVREFWSDASILLSGF